LGVDRNYLEKLDNEEVFYEIETKHGKGG
jgi:hypothetical protein